MIRVTATPVPDEMNVLITWGPSTMGRGDIADIAVQVVDAVTGNPCPGIRVELNETGLRSGTAVTRVTNAAGYITNVRYSSTRDGMKVLFVRASDPSTPARYRTKEGNPIQINIANGAIPSGMEFDVM